MVQFFVSYSGKDKIMDKHKRKRRNLKGNVLSHGWITISFTVYFTRHKLLAQLI